MLYESWRMRKNLMFQQSRRVNLRINGLAQAADGKSPGKDVADLMFKSLLQLSLM